MFSSQIYCVTFVNHRCTGGFTYFALHFIHATFCIEPRICNPIIELTTLLQSCGFTIEKQELKDWHFNEFEIVMKGKKLQLPMIDIEGIE